MGGEKKRKKTKLKKTFIYRAAKERRYPPVQERLPVSTEVINHMLEVKHMLMCRAK